MMLFYIRIFSSFAVQENMEANVRALHLRGSRMILEHYFKWTRKGTQNKRCNRNKHILKCVEHDFLAELKIDVQADGLQWPWLYTGEDCREKPFGFGFWCKRETNMQICCRNL